MIKKIGLFIILVASSSFALPLPKGSYQSNCHDCTFDNNKNLTCTCHDPIDGGDWKPKPLNLQNIAKYNDIFWDKQVGDLRIKY